jgi:hypothetical protein
VQHVEQRSQQQAILCDVGGGPHGVGLRTG